MFTGIIQELGEIQKIESQKTIKTFTVKTNSSFLINKKIGDSIAVNGVCVSITKKNKNHFTFDAIKETLNKTNFNELKKNKKINLESSLKINQSLDGHIIQGHVDGIGKIKNLKISNKNNISFLEITLPEILEKYIAFKGSISINGVSLTISDLTEKTFRVDLIPHTIKKTNLQFLKKNDKVNLEIDIIARYLERLLNCKEKESKYFFLKERNLI